MLSTNQRQTNLKFLGFSTVKAFQQSYGLTADNIYGPKTDAKLIEVIKYVQNKIGTTADGMVGNNTVAKAKAWQAAKGLTADGIIGPTSRAWLEIPNFNRTDFKCKCGCGTNNINVEVVKMAQNIRNHFGKPVIVASGVRCAKHNAATPGAVSNSRHVLGKAIDLSVSGVNVNTVLAYAKTLVAQGKLRYTYTNNTNMKGLVHIDIK